MGNVDLNKQIASQLAAAAVQGLEVAKDANGQLYSDITNMPQRAGHVWEFYNFFLSLLTQDEQAELGLGLKLPPDYPEPPAAAVPAPGGAPLPAPVPPAKPGAIP